MSIYYIRNMRNYEELLSDREKRLPRCANKICACFKIVFSRFTKKGNIIILHLKENQKISINKIQKLVADIVKKEKCKSVVLSKKLNNNEELKNILNSYNIEILNGRYLFRFLIFDILDFILKKINKKIQDMELSVMVNELDEINAKSIFLLAKKVKRLNIITNHIEVFKKIEQKLSDEGIMIMVSNNKRKSLLKSDVVINIDFVEENLKEYKLNNNCAIINISNAIKVYNKGFNGININNYNICFENEIIEKYNLEFDEKILYESKIYEINDFNKILDMIEKDKVFITEIIGNKGAIFFD